MHYIYFIYNFIYNFYISYYKVLEKAMANHFSILALRTPWTVWKSTKIWHWKMTPPQVYECENWTVKKDEHRRIDTFKLWLWKRLSRVSWTARRSNQSILKEISPEYSLEGLMLRVMLQYLMWRADLLKKTLMLGRLRARGQGSLVCFAAHLKPAQHCESAPRSTDMPSH